MVAYKLGTYTVTAVKLINTSNQRIALDPRTLQGDFYAATFQHGFLDRAGTPEDTTVVYLVTQGGGLNKRILPSAFLDTEKEERKSEPRPFATDSDVDPEGDML